MRVTDRPRPIRPMARARLASGLDYWPSPHSLLVAAVQSLVSPPWPKREEACYIGIWRRVQRNQFVGVLVARVNVFASPAQAPGWKRVYKTSHGRGWLYILANQECIPQQRPFRWSNQQSKVG